MDLLVLETPLEALALSYFSAAAGSLWAWIAVIATALGLWRIQAVGSKSSIAPPPSSPPSDLNTHPTPAAPSTSPETAVSSPFDGAGGSPKGRFTAYFYEECSDERTDGDGEDEVAAAVEQPWRRELVGIWRRGDLGWYRYQDLTVLNGSVVRLWDGAVRV